MAVLCSCPAQYRIKGVDVHLIEQRVKMCWRFAGRYAGRPLQADTSIIYGNVILTIDWFGIKSRRKGQ
jgi:hypothetical protein